MPLVVNLRHLETKNLRLAGELAAQELELANVDELIHAHQPLKHDLEVQKLDDEPFGAGPIAAHAGMPVRSLPETF